MNYGEHLDEVWLKTRDGGSLKARTYLLALGKLRRQDLRWQPTFARYLKQNDTQRLAWVARIERRAQAKREYPRARELVVMAMTVRMTS